jgi:hypothetical protein
LTRPAKRLKQVTGHYQSNSLSLRENVQDLAAGRHDLRLAARIKMGNNYR